MTFFEKIKDKLAELFRVTEPEAQVAPVHTMEKMDGGLWVKESIVGKYWGKDAEWNNTLNVSEIVHLVEGESGRDVHISPYVSTFYPHSHAEVVGHYYRPATAAEKKAWCEWMDERRRKIEDDMGGLCEVAE